jgi:hypothetical protein
MSFCIRSDFALSRNYSCFFDDYNHLSEAEAIRISAAEPKRFPEHILNINIITGSMPYRKRHIIQRWFSLRRNFEMYAKFKQFSIEGMTGHN